MASNKTGLQIKFEYALAWALIAALRHLPLALAERVARVSVAILDRAVPKLRRIARTNLSFAFPHWTEKQREQNIDGVFATTARMTLMLARLPDLTPANVTRWIHYDGLEHYQTAKACGKGILIATGHLGNWELSAYAHALMTEPMNVMVRPLDNPLIDGMVEKRRAGSGNRLISKREAARSVLKALRANEAVGILVDQNTSLAEGVFVDFFGKAASANAAFVKLAYHSKAIVIPGFALWNEATRNYTLRFYPAVPLSGDLQADTQELHSRLEEIIRRHPDQWMWIHRRWKTRPPGEPTLY